MVVTKLNETLILPDGRTLGYAEYGQPDGFPVMYFHGGNGSRLEAQWFIAAANQLNIRLIAPERPGFGLSDFQLNRTMLDWVNDVKMLADALGIEQFSVFGLSGGAPFVAACAYAMPERLRSATIVSGTAPPDAKNRFKGMWFPVRTIFFTARRAPRVLRFLLNQMGSFYADEAQMRKRMLQAMPAPDKALIEQRPEVLTIFAQDAREAHRNGIEGDAYEWQLYVNDWGFDVADITMRVGLWFGEYDTQVPPAMGEYYASTLPDNVYHNVPDGGHFSTINNHITAILTDLVR